MSPVHGSGHVDCSTSAASCEAIKTAQWPRGAAGAGGGNGAGVGALCIYGMGDAMTMVCDIMAFRLRLANCEHWLHPLPAFSPPPPSRRSLLQEYSGRQNPEGEDRPKESSDVPVWSHDLYEETKGADR